MQLGHDSWLGLAGKGVVKAPQRNYLGGEISTWQEVKGPGQSGEEGRVNSASQKLQWVTFCCFLLSRKK